MIKFDNEKLRKIRKEMNLTQEQLAEKADLSDRHLRSMESGKAEVPSAILLYNISRALGKPMEEFFKEESEEYEQ